MHLLPLISNFITVPSITPSGCELWSKCVRIVFYISINCVILQAKSTKTWFLPVKCGLKTKARSFKFEIQIPAIICFWKWNFLSVVLAQSAPVWIGERLNELSEYLPGNWIKNRGDLNWDSNIGKFNFISVLIVRCESALCIWELRVQNF